MLRSTDHSTFCPHKLTRKLHTAIVYLSMPKKQKSTNVPVEKILIIAGLSLIILGCISSIYYAAINQRFIWSAPTVMSSFYYLSYLITLGGGFLAGYGLTKGTVRSKLFSGVAYGLLAAIFYFLLFAVQFLIQIFFGYLPYPWGMYLFNGSPLYALILTVLAAYLLQYRTKLTEFNVKAKLLFVVAFLTSEVYSIANNIYFSLTAPGEYDSTVAPWMIVAGYLARPLVVAAVAYLFLGVVKNRLHRLFYAAFIGSFANILMLVLWNFQTDPYVAAVNQFQIFSLIVIIFATGLLIVKTRLAAK